MNGLIVIDKPSGITSHDVVSRLRRITGEKSIGHLGTLDPLATGVLPLLLGKFTRLAQWFSMAEKSYSGVIRFGFATDTWDADGEPLSPQTVPQTTPHLSLDQIRGAATRFHGQLQQMPPPFSAKKIAGTPAYKLARQGKPVELKPATVTIDSFEILSFAGAEAEFTMRISAGGYVRSVAHELGQALGCGAHLAGLRRTRAGAFTLEDAHTLDELQPLAGNLPALEDLCIHPRALLPAHAFRHRRRADPGQAPQRHASQSARVLRPPRWSRSSPASATSSPSPSASPARCSSPSPCWDEETARGL